MHAPGGCRARKMQPQSTSEEEAALELHKAAVRALQRKRRRAAAMAPTELGKSWAGAAKK